MDFVFLPKTYKVKVEFICPFKFILWLILILHLKILISLVFVHKDKDS